MFRRDAFASSLEAHIARSKLSLRDAAKQIDGVSASTLTRLMRGSQPDLESFSALCRWMHQEPGAFFEPLEALSDLEGCYALQRLDDLNQQAEEDGELRLVQFWPSDASFLRQAVQAGDPGLAPLAKVIVALRSDQALSEKAKNKLIELIKAAYSCLVERVEP